MKLICNLTSCWSGSTMGRLPTNKLLSGSKWDQGRPRTSWWLGSMTADRAYTWKGRGGGGGGGEGRGKIYAPGQDGTKQNSRASMFLGTGSVHSRCKWNNLVHKRIMCSCWKWNKARSRWDLFPLAGLIKSVSTNSSFPIPSKWH